MKSLTLNLDFCPNPSQQAFFRLPQKFLLANGGYGSGKSCMICNKALVTSFLHLGTVGLIGRKTYPELRDTTRRTFFEWCPKELVKKWNQTENHLTFHGGSEIIFRALDDIFKLGSLELGWFAIDELSEFDEPEVFDYLRARLRHPKGPHKGFAATNPATKEHWLYKKFVESKDSDFGVVEVDTYSNKDHLPQEYIIDLEKYPEEWQERYLRGKWGVVPKGTRVYSHFFPKIHCHEDIQYLPYSVLYRSWDFGFRHPGVLFAQEDGLGRLLFLKEILGTEVDIRDFRDQVIKKTNEWFPQISYVEDFGDIAGNQRLPVSLDKSPLTCFRILSEKGIEIKAKKTKSIEDGIEMIQKLLRELRGGMPAIAISRKGCPIFIDALCGGYYRDKTGAATGDDYFDHLSDCARYLVTHLYGIIERPVWRKYNQTNNYITISQKSQRA